MSGRQHQDQCLAMSGEVILETENWHLSGTLVRTGLRIQYSCLSEALYFKGHPIHICIWANVSRPCIHKLTQDNVMFLWKFYENHSTLNNSNKTWTHDPLTSILTRYVWSSFEYAVLMVSKSILPLIRACCSAICNSIWQFKSQWPIYGRQHILTQVMYYHTKAITKDKKWT